jgi:hypothetical protein
MTAAELATVTSTIQNTTTMTATADVEGGLLPGD